MSRGTCAIALPNGKAYVFQGTTYTRFDFASGVVDVGGFVIHPDYIDGAGDHLAAQHTDHMHMQVGKTRV